MLKTPKEQLELVILDDLIIRPNPTRNTINKDNQKWHDTIQIYKWLYELTWLRI